MFVVEGKGVIEIRTKQTEGRGVLACVYVCFFHFFFFLNSEIFKIKFYIYSPVFPIDHNDSMKY